MLIKTNTPQIGFWLAGIYTDRNGAHRALFMLQMCVSECLYCVANQNYEYFIHYFHLHGLSSQLYC